MSSRMPQRRRRAETEGDEDVDNLRESPRSTPYSEPGKRARTNGYQASESPEPYESDANTSQLQSARTSGPADERDSEVGPGEFQPGAIIRVKLTNFVTYENAEFFPGPNLNMVIGPNGTGKSSLVCAICLGLGYGAKHLGRAGEVGEFVKHNTTEAYIEIELQRRKNEMRNHIIRVRIAKDNNNRDWWLNNKKTSMKAIQDLTRSLSIQIDNLCQFLPQDKVSEFAALTPVELLQQTQRAAAPEQMLDWHNELKRYRKEQKELEMQNANDKEQLETLETRQDGLRAEVRKLEERKEIQDQVAFLNKSRPFVEYRNARREHFAFKERKLEAQERYKRLEARLAPTLQNLNRKNRLRNQIDTVAKERKQALQAAEKLADKCSSEIAAKDEEIVKIEQKRAAEVKAEKDIKNEISKLERKLNDLRARANDEPVQFNGAEYNDRVRAKEAEVRNIESQMRDLTARNKELTDMGRVNRREHDSAAQELAAFDTQEGQQMNKLEIASKETAVAWKWVQENMESFEKEIYGPPIVSCSIKDQRYTDVVEAPLRFNDFLAITAQTKADHKKLQNQILGTMKLAHITLRTSGEDILPRPPALSQNDMQRFGFEGWALDFVDGPQPVLNMLCGAVHLHSTAVSLRDISEEQHNMVIEDGRVSSWVAGGYKSQVTRRREYGSGVQSTATRPVTRGKFWTDQPVDSAAKREIQQRMEQLDVDFEKLKAEIAPLREKMQNFKTTGLKDLEKEISQIKNKKAEMQKAQGEQRALPEKIRREQESIDKKHEQRYAIHDQIQKIENQHDLAVQQKAKKAFEYKGYVDAIRLSHEALLEAEIRFIEASSDVEALEERNSGIVRHQEEEKERLKAIERESKIVKETAQRALRVCEAITAEEDEETNQRLQAIPDGLTLEALELDIASEESKLDFIQANNPNAIAQFERFQQTVMRLQSKVEEADQRLEKLQGRITEVRGKWEPQLDHLISTISDAFSYNFEQIGCAGEVDVEKTEDFDDWAIKIKVKFRENESLQILDKHRQSGGERSVSTIFYLMALQSLARSPFRVVDEINQGMDPRNERMVHERMVEIACKEHTSQYFLITPKLLTGLRYDRRMKVLCIASGEYMPQDYSQLDVTKIIGLRRAIVGAA